MQKKIPSLLRTQQFWPWFLGGTAGVFLLETFFLGLWTLPIIGYRIPYMGERTAAMLWFATIYAILFGFGLSVFLLVRKHKAASCAIASGSGVTALFTMLCPICPVFFLAYFGASATILAFVPYFWGLRLLAMGLLIVGIILLWRRLEPDALLRSNGYVITQSIAVVLIGILIVGNQAIAMHMGTMLMGGNSSNQGIVLSGDFASNIATLVTPSTVPFYGQELGLDMSNINAINTSIRKLATMAPQQGSNPIQLSPENMKRYIDIGTEPYVTCEFCCGVKTLVREDGSPTCGCAHSIAMRGTAAYLLANYPEMTNAEISYELMRQKGLYFPTQMQERMASSLAGDISDFKPDIGYLAMNLSESELADLQARAKTSGFTPETKAPGMVGGC